MHRQIRFYILTLIIFLSNPLLWSQSFDQEYVLRWKGVINEQVSPQVYLNYIYFENATIDPSTSLPHFSEDLNINSRNSEILTKIENPIFETVSTEEKTHLESIGFSEKEINIHCQIVEQRKLPIAVVDFIPIRLNSENGQYEKLISFNLLIDVIDNGNAQLKSNLKIYAENSVLHSGEWYKIKVAENGIYKITYNDLTNYGIDPSSINPHNIGIFGNTGKMLPEKNSIFRYDDLYENAIFVSGEEDGSFDQEDYILFYGIAPGSWRNSLGFFVYELNLYDDNNFYFLTPTEGTGKRLETEIQTTSQFSKVSQEFNDYKIIEDEKHNLILSGKSWYGDEFGETNSRTYHFSFPDIKDDEDIIIKTEVSNRTFINDKFVINVNGIHSDTVILTSVDVASTKYAVVKRKTIHYNDLGSEIDVEIKYFPADQNSHMWLDYININVTSHLNLTEDQLIFRDLNSVSDGATTQFNISNSDETTSVWEITDPLNPIQMITDYNNSQTSIIADTDILREFIAFRNSGFKKAEFVSNIENQDLHGSGPFDYIIVTHSLFRDQAEQLAQLHESYDGFTTLVVEPEMIYNEFSSGKQDPTAIRDLLKLYYDKFENQEPRFLLLFGDGSFDPKDRLEHNTNLIPTFQTEESWVTATSYVVDDYFGLLDDTEGDDATGYLDIGIGRLPVQTIDEAQNMVDKVIRYLTPGEPQFGNWRSKLCMIADDEDGNLHLEQADSLADGEGFVTPVYNQNKIYLDAFPQLRTPSGDKYPEVTERINEQVEEGALIINYIGHGGTGGWAHERIIQQNDMLNWKNKYKLPMFVTATCEFSRFDEPELVSGGEMVMLNPEGGGIALFTTTRLAYSQSNFRLNQRLYARAFVPVDNEMPYLGDLIRESKPPGQLTTRNFVLLGDPGVRLCYPKYNIKTLKFNGISIEEEYQDTVRALQQITISGLIEDLEGQKMSNFNGILTAQLFDKYTIYNTIGNDANSFAVEFKNQDKILWEGDASVENGEFNLTFVIPKDISFNYGSAKLSYYAHSETEDASGYFNEFILGGLNEDASVDNVGPEIDLFINDTTFISGDQTHENPLLIAKLYDEHGINQSQNGIGHDISLVLDENYSNVMIMNDHYKQSINDYRSGYIEYPFYDLPDGTHTLTLKAWDSYNNSSTATIEFVIDRYSELKLYEVKNYPNPFSDLTTFTFKHTRPGDKLNIQLSIFDLNGGHVISYETDIETDNTEVPFLTWNGRDVNGSKLSEGIYIYTVVVSDEIGQVSIQRQKLVLRD